jgi:hypothetical protein
MIEREQEEGNEATALLEFHERMGSRSAECKLQSSLGRMEAYGLEFISRREFFPTPLAREYTLSPIGLILRSKVIHRRLDSLGVDIPSSMFNNIVLIISPTLLSKIEIPTCMAISTLSNDRAQ